jgi:hypothetical protein
MSRCRLPARPAANTTGIADRTARLILNPCDCVTCCGGSDAERRNVPLPSRAGTTTPHAPRRRRRRTTAPSRTRTPEGDRTRSLNPCSQVVSAEATIEDAASISVSGAPADGFTATRTFVRVGRGAEAAPRPRPGVRNGHAARRGDAARLGADGAQPRAGSGGVANAAPIAELMGGLSHPRGTVLP